MAFIVGAAVGGVAGAGAMLIAFPYLFPPAAVDETVSFDVAVSESDLWVSTAFREDSPGQDFAHWAKGQVSVFRLQDESVRIQLHEAFEASPGPNYWLYLNTTALVEDETDFLADEGRLKLAKLKSFEGSQVYQANSEQMNEKRAVTIWCESFNQYIASASFHGTSTQSSN